MYIKYVKFKDKKRRILLIALLFLIAIYFLIQYFDSNEAIANKVEFDKEKENIKIVLGGEACGIKLLAEGVLIVEVDNPNLKLNVGDIILQIDDNKIDSNSELVQYINRKEKKGKEITLTIKNSKTIKKIKTTPKLNNDTGLYELGIWVKDSSAGVGMITFYETNTNRFAALGHGITETSKNVVLPISTGAIVKSKIVKINKGEKDAPGDIRATIYKEVWGQIRKNTSNGIYGTLETDYLLQGKNEYIDIAYKNEIKTGKAYIYCTLDNEGSKKYEIDIKNVFYDSTTNKNMIIKITDDKLLEKTGGIIQGMSGSPIVQNGKLIGAVTHVFLNDPTSRICTFYRKYD